MLDYRPDFDPRTKDVLLDVRDMIPTVRGYRSAHAQVSYGLGYTYSLAANEVYPNYLFASRWVSSPGGIIIAATNQKLNVFAFNTGYANVSKAGNYSLAGSVYQYGEDAAACFDLCAFGDVLIACHKSTPTQYRTALDLTTGTLFANLTGSPQANTCCVARNFVFLGDCGNWSTVTGSPDILGWSAIGDHTDWTVDPLVTQASFAIFQDTPGPITAVRPFRDGIVVFKANSMYRGRYVGGADVWAFERISDKIGCVGKRSVTNIDSSLIFVGKDDIYRYDGTPPTPITMGICETIRPVLNFNGHYALLVGHDKNKSSVVFHTSGESYVWSYKYDRWGKQHDVFAGQSIPCYTNSDDFRGVTLDTVSAGAQSYITTTDHSRIYTLSVANGVPYNRYLARSALGRVTTGAIGKPDAMTTLTRVNPIYATRPATVGNATLAIGASKTPASFSTIGTVTMNASYRFDNLGTSGTNNNFFQLTHTCAEDHEILGFDTDPNMKPTGSR